MITLETRTVFHCKCVRPECGWEWDALKKPRRCAKCKYRTWNGEDQRFTDPYTPNGSPWARKAVPPGSRIAIGKKVPSQPPSYREMLKTFTEARKIIDQVIFEYGACNHDKNECICAEVKTLANIDRQIRKLSTFTDTSALTVKSEEILIPAEGE